MRQDIMARVRTSVLLRESAKGGKKHIKMTEPKEMWCYQQLFRNNSREEPQSDMSGQEKVIFYFC